MLDIVQRYIPVVNAIKRARLKTKKIVEVGGTGEGVAFYLPDYEIIDCDIQFVKNILHNVTPIKNKGGRLPLPDNYVDILISVDMLEHLPIKKNREKMVKEMLRVAKSKVILTIPTGEKSLEAVRKFGELFHKKYPKIKNKYVIEHLTYGHPEKEEVINMIKEMPEESSATDILARLYFYQKVNSGLKELDEGKGIPHEEVKNRMKKWLS